MSEGESGSKHAVDCVYLSKIPSYHQEFVSLQMLGVNLKGGCHSVGFYPNCLDFLPINFQFEFYQ